MRTNCYVVSASSWGTIVIDPGDQFELIAAAIDSGPDREVHGVLCTHGHFDHVMVATAVSETYEAPIHLHPADSTILRRSRFFHSLLQGGEPFAIPPIDVPLADGMRLCFGGLDVNVMHTPGHSPGAVCFAIDDVIFTGDTIGSEGPGRTDLPGGSLEALRESLRRLTADYAPNTVLYPGHGMPVRLDESTAGVEVQQPTSRSQPRDG